MTEINLFYIKIVLRKDGDFLDNRRAGRGMDIKNIDLYNLPKWFSGLLEEVDFLCEEALAGSVSYQKLKEERCCLLNQYDFLLKLADKDKIAEPLELTQEETDALSRFFALEYDKARTENIQMYLLGGSHVLKLLRALEGI